jgi:transposase
VAPSADRPITTDRLAVAESAHRASRASALRPHPEHRPAEDPEQAFGPFQYPTAPLEGARTGAPHATQVADRWHVWHNLGEAVETVVVTHRASLPEPAPLPADQPNPATPPTQPQTPLSPDSTQPDQPLRHKEIRLVTRTRERHAAVQALLAEGCTRAEIGRRLGLDPQTVRRFADAPTVDELLANTRRETLIDTYTPYLRQRWDNGCTDATTLLDEIRDQGFRGSIQTVRRYLQPFRATTSTGGTRPNHRPRPLRRHHQSHAGSPPGS